MQQPAGKNEMEQQEIIYINPRDIKDGGVTFETNLEDGTVQQLFISIDDLLTFRTVDPDIVAIQFEDESRSPSEPMIISIANIRHLIPSAPPTSPPPPQPPQPPARPEAFSEVAVREAFMSMPLPGSRRRPMLNNSLVKSLPPKRPANAYTMFYRKHRRELKAAFPHLNKREISVRCGKEWNKLDDTAKSEFYRLADKDRFRYAKEMTEYKNSDSYKEIMKLNSQNISTVPRGDDVHGETYMCDICSETFSTSHNLHEHLIGQYHIRNLSSYLTIQKAKDTVNSLCDSVDPENLAQALVNMCPECNGPVDVPSFVDRFYCKFYEQQNELKELRQKVADIKNRRRTLKKDADELKKRKTKLEVDMTAVFNSNLALVEKIDVLKISKVHLNISPP